MGRRVFWADRGISYYAGIDPDYAVAHALADGVWVGASSHIWVGQALDQTFMVTVNGLPYGHYYYAVETRTPDVEDGTNTWLTGLFQIDLQPKHNFGNLPNKLVSEGVI